MQSTTLRPGLLVSLKTAIRGNVSYKKVMLEAEHVTDDGAEEAKWETQRRIDNPDEFKRAQVARSKARALISSVCAQSAFGLLCPESDADKLEAAVAEARVVADEFNRSAMLSNVSVYIITGRVAPDDVEAVKAINSEVRDLLSTMARGVEKLDVKAIREAASRAREVGGMLSPDAEARVKIAIETAREAAKRIVKAGEQAAQEIDKSAVRKITEMRTAFLELGDQAEIQKPTTRGRGVDLASVGDR